MIRLKTLQSFGTRKVLIKSYSSSSFDCCHLVQIFSISSYVKEINNLQERALWFLYNHYKLTCEQLLVKADKGSMNVNRLRILCSEIYRTLNNLNPKGLN